jgi:mono/diheme cytochrome c family protein
LAYHESVEIDDDLDRCGSTPGKPLLMIRCTPRWISLTVGLLVALGSAQRLTAQPPSLADQRQQADAISALVDQAAEAYKKEDYETAMGKVEQASQEIQQLAPAVDSKIAKVLEPTYQRLRRARELLALQGAVLEKLPEWDAIRNAKAGDLADPKGDKEAMQPAGGISFTKEILPWMNQQCGNCHIRNNRGDFRMATFNELMKGSSAGVVVFPGDPRSSRLVEVIESGDMPRGGGKVSAENLEKLKNWIAQGALFDGPLADAPLAPANPPAANNDAMIALPTGKETVSFGKEIAPVLVEQCRGCHIDAMQVRGGLRMDTFRQLLNGGDSGSILKPGDGDGSILVQKLRGMGGGQRMPAGGRPPLSDEIIGKIVTWIDEGATFDGGSPDDSLEQVASRTWAASVSEEELREKRWERARGRWSLVLSDAKPVELADESFLILSDLPESQLTKLRQAAQRASDLVAKQWKIPDGVPLVRGGVVLYAYGQRYDYGEFGKMVEKRSLPAEWTGHWRRSTLDAYAALHVPVSGPPEALDALLVQLLASLHVASYDAVPNWFAEGIGRSTVAMAMAKSDPRVKQWERQIPAIVSRMKDPKPFLEGKMSEEETALVAFGLVQTVIQKSQRKSLDRLLKELRDGGSFPQVFVRCLQVPPETFVRAVAGIPGG